MTDIRLENLTKFYGTGPAAVRAVDGVSLEIASGEFFFLLGPSGCGKSTLLRMIAGLIEPSAGRVFFGGRDVTARSVEKRNSAMVFQNYALWPHMTVRQNVEFGPKMHGHDRAARRRIAEANLARVQMDALGKRRPSQLSGGQQQRVALARALAAEGDCLLLDEPLSNLDARLRLHMRTELRRLVKETGVTAVYVTHDQKEALSMADRIAVMNEGRIVQVGPPEEIYNRPAIRFVADFLGEANFLSGQVLPDSRGTGILSAPGEIRRGEPVCPTGVPPVVPAQAGDDGRDAHATGEPAHATGEAAPAGLLAVQTTIGIVLCEPAPGAGLTPGRAVTCCIRPERIAVLADPAAPAPAGANVLPAAVVSSMYLGELRQYVLQLADQTTWKAFVLADRLGAMDAGQAVRLAFHPADVSLLTP